MKHLKTYENNSEQYTPANDNSKLKTYIVWDMGKSVNINSPSKEFYYILKLLEIKDKELVLKTIYSYRKNNLTTYPEEQPIYIEKDIDHYLDEFILYQSDDLKECIDVLPTLYSQNKYNL